MILKIFGVQKLVYIRVFYCKYNYYTDEIHMMQLKCFHNKIFVLIFKNSSNCSIIQAKVYYA